MNNLDFGRVSLASVTSVSSMTMSAVTVVPMSPLVHGHCLLVVALASLVDMSMDVLMDIDVTVVSVMPISVDVDDIAMVSVVSVAIHVDDIVM